MIWNYDILIIDFFVKIGIFYVSLNDIIFIFGVIERLGDMVDIGDNFCGSDKEVWEIFVWIWKIGIRYLNMLNKMNERVFMYWSYIIYLRIF